VKKSKIVSKRAGPNKSKSMLETIKDAKSFL